MEYIVYVNKGVYYGIPFCKILKITEDHAEAKYFAALNGAEVVAIGELDECAYPFEIQIIIIIKLKNIIRI